MRKNLIQSGKRNKEGRTIIPFDWFEGTIPENVHIAENVYIDSSFGFASFYSINPYAMELGYASSCYDRVTFVTTGNGVINLGDYSIVNGCTLICSNHIHIGNYVMIAWGSVIYDNYLGSDLSDGERCRFIKNISKSERREMPFSTSSPVIIEDNVWIGFDVVIKPGTIIRHGSVIGSKSVISGDVPPYSVVVGNPGKIIKTLDPTDKGFFEKG